MTLLAGGADHQWNEIRVQRYSNAAEVPLAKRAREGRGDAGRPRQRSWGRPSVRHSFVAEDHEAGDTPPMVEDHSSGDAVPTDTPGLNPLQGAGGWGSEKLEPPNGFDKVHATQIEFMRGT